jgi:hypothetical protein
MKSKRTCQGLQPSWGEEAGRSYCPEPAELLGRKRRGLLGTAVLATVVTAGCVFLARPYWRSVLGLGLGLSLLDDLGRGPLRLVNQFVSGLLHYQHLVSSINSCEGTSLGHHLVLLMSSFDPRGHDRPEFVMELGLQIGRRRLLGGVRLITLRKHQTRLGSGFLLPQLS